MKRTKQIVIFMICTLLIFMCNWNMLNAQEVVSYDSLGSSEGISEDFLEKVDEIVKMTMKKSKVPGLSLAIVKGDSIKYLNYGYADKESHSKVTENTLFELGSMSKAYTGLAILLLEQEGKLSLTDKVSDYIPWLNFTYDGYGEESMKNSMTIVNLLYHTSGIPFATIGEIPEGKDDDALEKTIRMLDGRKLDFYPGEKYKYATVNYDILAYIIQKITNMPYEDYMSKEILEKLDLQNTYMYRYEEEVESQISQGYKFRYFNPVAYNPPEYRGNTAAGYIVSNGVDMAKWMRLQLGITQTSVSMKTLIEKSHQPSTREITDQEGFYGAGWFVSMHGDVYKHGGTNPTFSSMIELMPSEKLGVCILTNMNSSAAEYIGDSIIDLAKGSSSEAYKSDFYKMASYFFTILSGVCIVAIIVYLVAMFFAIVEIIQKKRRYVKERNEKFASILFIIPLLLFTGVCIYNIPSILFERLPWKAIGVWASNIIPIGCLLGYCLIDVFMLYISLTFNFIKGKEKNYLALVPISLINGVASALIIFTINESFNRNLEYSKELLLYFLFSIVTFVYTIKLLQGKMIYITNELTYDMRIKMVEKILKAPYQLIENLGQEKIYTSLNNDTSAISELPNVVVNIVSNILTLVFCLCYLMVKSFYAFLASAALILVNGAISFIASQIASRYWEKNRNIQETFFGQMKDLVYGFKELVLNTRRKLDFKQEMVAYTRKSADFSKIASLKLLNFNVYNALMYNLIFGVVVFIFPMVMRNISVNDLRENLFIVFYLIGPFGALTTAIARYTQINVNMKRINELIEELDAGTGEHVEETAQIEELPGQVSIEMRNVEYWYNIKENEDDRHFHLGPVNTTFHTEQISFIIGGNGSGKSTLGKLISGLYCSQKGDILVNGSKVSSVKLHKYFSAVYSDFHLFEKLYGMDYLENKESVKTYLSMLKIDDKIHLNDEGIFESLSLSTGQKKRLAFVISCLDNKPMMIFDEWAAEQDPVFRDYFYMELLPFLKKKGKGVIVITHDDRYFSTADQVIKMDCGAIVANQE